jgi:spore germination protein YaaH
VIASQRLQIAAWVALAALVIAGLLLPPLSLADRIATPGYRRVRPGGTSVVVPADGDGAAASIEFPRAAILRATRVKLRVRERTGLGVDALPAGGIRVGSFYSLDFRGPVPTAGRLRAALPIREDEHAFIDPYGWDGEVWRWLPPRFASEGRVEVALPLDDFAPEWIAFVQANEGRTEVGAVLEPPPAQLPAAAAELPILEVRAYTVADAEGALGRRPFPPASRGAAIWGVVDNLEGARVRDDLVSNLLIHPDARRRHRAAIVEAAQADGLAGIVLDFHDVPDDLQAARTELSRLLAADLAAIGKGLVVTVPPPIRVDGGWDGGPLSWRALGQSGAALRLRLPADRPVANADLDSMVRWALGTVQRKQLQLAVPVHGIDVVDGQASPIGYGEALARMLDMARSDAPSRISPGEAATIELPTILAAELGREDTTGMWRFYWWDGNRRQHTVWLNDAEGLAPAFRVAARYHLGRLALDGVSSGLDPFVWRMVEGFVANNEVVAPAASYQLRWRLSDPSGTVVQEAVQPLEEPTFAFRAPPALGEYTLAVDLLTGERELAALGNAMPVRVAPAPRATPTPTPLVFTFQPTPERYETAPPPIDERVTRTPVRIAAGDRGGPDLGAGDDYDATFDASGGLLRAGPSTLDEVVADLRPGDRLALLERSTDRLWWRVRMLSTGLEGWVAADLLRLRPTSLPGADRTPTPTSAAPLDPSVGNGGRFPGADPSSSPGPPLGTAESPSGVTPTAVVAATPSGSAP